MTQVFEKIKNNLRVLFFISFICLSNVVFGQLVQQTSSTFQNLNSVDFCDGQNGYACGGQVVKTANGGNNWTLVNSVQQTADGGFLVAGNTFSFGNGNSHIYIIKTDSNGNSGCNESIANTTVTSPLTIITSPVVQISSGGTSGTPATQISGGGTATTLCFTNGIDEIIQENFIRVYPNPFSTQTTLQTDKFLKNASVTIYNSVGQTVKQIDNLDGQTIILHRDNLPGGLYFLRLTEGNKTFSADKLVITDK